MGIEDARDAGPSPTPVPVPVLLAQLVGDQVPDSARRLAIDAVATAAATADSRRSHASAAATALLGASRRGADELLARARQEADELRADAQRDADDLGRSLTEARRMEAETLRDLAAAQEARTLAELAARELRGNVITTSSAALLHAEQALTEARRRRRLAELEAADVVARALNRATELVSGGRQELDAAGQLLVESAPGGAWGARLAPPAPPAPAAIAAAIEAADAPTLAPPAPVEAPPRPRYLVPALSIGKELVLRLLVLAGVITTAWFWLWWLGAGHGTWTTGSIVVTTLLVWVFALPVYFSFFVCRMARPNPAIPVPDCRVAIVVTKAPSEPWDVVERTLEGMLAQDYPYPYDVWLADEQPSDETRAWCAARGVQVSTRFGVPEYHQLSWPRRTRSKEGNLAYFYDHYGYERYDVVVQLDADHVPVPSYLQHMVRPFADPQVGYVCAPSVCDANADESWTVRGRVHREAAMHGPVQAGSNDGYAPVCIGSHYAVRTAALRDVGGIGPELAEDYSTTLALQAGGWEGVFSIDAEARGDGPASLGEMLLQELQWSRSLGTMLTRYAPRQLGKVPWRGRLRLGFALGFYPLQGVAVALATVLPLVGIVTQSSWGQTSLAGFYLHLWPCSLTALALTLYLRACGLLRPRNAKLWSWELLLFQFVRWPWTFWGFLQGMYAGLRSQVVNFKVTPKARGELKPLRPQLLVPSLVLGLVPAWTVILVSDPGAAVGFMILSTMQATTYLLVVAATVALHIASNRRRVAMAGGPQPTWDPATWGLTWDNGGRAATIAVAALVPTTLGLVWRLGVVGL